MSLVNKKKNKIKKKKKVVLSPCETHPNDNIP